MLVLLVITEKAINHKLWDCAILTVSNFGRGREQSFDYVRLQKFLSHLVKASSMAGNHFLELCPPGLLWTADLVCRRSTTEESRLIRAF